MTVEYGTKDDISSWMKLVSSISWNFPALETAEKLKGHENTVLCFMSHCNRLSDMILYLLSDCVQGAANLPYRREVVYMSTYEVLTLLILFGTFLIALLAYLDNRYKRK